MNCDKNLLENICKNHYSYAEVLRELNIKGSGTAYFKIKKLIKEYDIDISHFTGRIWQSSPNSKKQKYSEKHTLEEVFCKDSKIGQKVLREYVRRHNMIEYKCQICGCDGNWQNRIISLELDHIDGDNHNNEISNLRYLCPNCHASTDTYRGKNKHNKRIKLENNKL